MFQGKNINILTKSECDLQLEPMMAKNAMTFTLTGVSPGSEQKIVQYIKENGNYFIIYSNINNQWIKQYVPNYKTPLNEYDDYFKAIKKATLITDLDDVAIYEVIIDGNYLKEDMKRTLASSPMSGTLLPGEFFDNLGDFKYTITINKKTAALSKIDIDLTRLFVRIGNNIAETKELTENQKMVLRQIFNSINQAAITVTFSQMNNTDNILIPEEALDAKTADIPLT